MRYLRYFFLFLFSISMLFASDSRYTILYKNGTEAVASYITIDRAVTLTQLLLVSSTTKRPMIIMDMVSKKTMTFEYKKDDMGYTFLSVSGDLFDVMEVRLSMLSYAKDALVCTIAGKAKRNIPPDQYNKIIEALAESIEDGAALDSD